MSRLDKYANRVVKVELEVDGDVEVYEFKPMTTEQFVDYNNLTKEILDAEDDTDPNLIERVMNFQRKIVEYSYPGESEDAYRNFVMTHFNNFNKVLEAIAPTAAKEEDLDKYAKMKAKIEEMRKTRAGKVENNGTKT